MNHDQRRREILKLIEEYGLYNINQTSLAKHYKVTQTTISNDIKRILNVTDVIDADKVKFELNRFYKKAMKDAWKGFADPGNSQRDRRDWLRVALEVSNDTTKFLEAYGAKDKVMLGSLGEQKNVITIQDFEDYYKEQEEKLDDDAT